MTHHAPVELPKYPVTESPDMPDEGVDRQLATVLWVGQAVLVGCSVPVQLLMFFSLGWEGGDEAAKQRLIATMPPLGLGGLVLIALAVVTAPAVWRGSTEALTLSAVTTCLTLLLSIGWLFALRGDLFEVAFGAIWLAMTLPAPAAHVLLLAARRRVRREPESRPG